MNKKLSIIAVALAAVGCTQQTQQAEAPTPKGPVIVQVVSRNVTITARAGDSGPVYAAHSKDGQTIASGQTLEDLQATEPKLARHISGMQAGTWAGLD